MQIDPKVSMWIMLAGAVLGVLAAGGSQLTTIFGSGEANSIVAAAGLGVAMTAAVGGVLHGYSSSAPGPMAGK